MYGLNNPYKYADPDGEWAIAVLSALWAAVEAYLSASDAVSTAQTVADPQASLGEKAASVGLFAAGVVGPGGGGSTAFKNASKRVSKSAGRSGKQARLKQLADDPKVSLVDRGWLKQDMNQIQRGTRKSVRVPPGKNLAHRRGFEAKKGYGYEHSDLQEIDLHKLQHKHEGYK
ncbi:MAG: hypothetical protein D3909_18275 [Candidatus Electrothrix sp. ATG1]|nr:hypothetical protein [Candidatus Electrothrix sp. ATG1]